jgi:rubrerythrin
MKRTWIIGVLLSLVIVCQGCTTLITALKINIYKDKTLIEAVKKGDTKAVKSFLGRGADVNSSGSFDMTLVMLAARQGHIDITRILIDQGADVNAKDFSGNTALMKAVENGHAKTVKFLLDKGADLNLKNDHGLTAAAKANFCGDTDIIKLFAEKVESENLKNVLKKKDKQKTANEAKAEDGTFVQKIIEYIVSDSLVSYPQNNDPFRNLYRDFKSDNQAVDFQKSLFLHKDHQRRLSISFMGNKEEFCRVCHHKKKRGEGPKHCNSCHTVNSVSRSLLIKQGRNFMFEASKGALGFLNESPEGKMLGLRDAYHGLCMGCHIAKREGNTELLDQERKAPLLCIGCHKLRY